MYEAVRRAHNTGEPQWPTWRDNVSVGEYNAPGFVDDEARGIGGACGLCVKGPCLCDPGKKEIGGSHEQ